MRAPHLLFAQTFMKDIPNYVQVEKRGEEKTPNTSTSPSPAHLQSPSQNGEVKLQYWFKKFMGLSAPEINLLGSCSGLGKVGISGHCWISAWCLIREGRMGFLGVSYAVFFARMGFDRLRKLFLHIPPQELQPRRGVGGSEGS